MKDFPQELVLCTVFDIYVVISIIPDSSQTKFGQVCILVHVYYTSEPKSYLEKLSAIC